ncbi:FAD-binding oxidoreductase [Amycolatopsis jejuensis]|uniref:FAD-binding oxidoreductase n=1 Tax=Amycolatopsis jejuensis TaxID=330084 RepID=UPI000A54D313|nr:FAD-binding oxidoreductase [Amycolatopsis jejuensis]
MTAENAVAELLRAGLAADQVHTTGPGYDTAVALWNGAAVQKPAVVVECRSTADVQAAVRGAREAGLPLSVRGGGHDWAGRALADGGITLDLRPLDSVVIDAERLTAVVGGGARANDLLGAAGKHGLTPITGAIGAVGVTGLVLGGGYGPLSGKYGLAADNLLGAEVVLADGTVVRADAGNEPDLWWALRGGGGNFGVVTSLELRLHAVPQITTGMILYPIADAAGVFARLAEVQATGPDELTVQSGVVSAPDGSPSVLVWPTWCGPADPDGLAARLGTPLLSTVAPVESYAAEIAGRDPMFPNGLSIVIRTRSLAKYTPDIAEVLVAQTEKRTSPQSSLSVHHFHGAAARVPVADTPFGLRENHLMVEVIGMGPDTDDRPWADATSAALAPHALPGGYANLLGPDVPDQVADAYGPNAARLREIKQRFDPDGVFSAIPLP